MPQHSEIATQEPRQTFSGQNCILSWSNCRLLLVLTRTNFVVRLSDQPHLEWPQDEHVMHPSTMRNEYWPQDEQALPLGWP